MMHERMKYIIFSDGLNPESPVIFPSWINHSEFAKVWCGAPIVGAGQVEVDPYGKVWCGGKSTSLKVKSRGETDAALIKKMLFREP